MLKYINNIIKKLDKKVFLILLIIAVLVTTCISCKKEGYENSASSALPKGIKKEDIPEGDEDLYIKKSEIVPPVCPKCPDLIQKDIDTSKCPPCPACKRCPAPAEVECKKVMKYGGSDINEGSMEIDIKEKDYITNKGMYKVEKTTETVSKLPSTGGMTLVEEDQVEIGGLLANEGGNGMRPVLADFSNFGF